MRHAEAAGESTSFEDRDRALTERGHADALKIAAEMKARTYVPEHILCSIARRTKETCRHVTGILGADIPTRFEPGLYLASERTVLNIIRGTDAVIKAALVIGHNPGLEELGAALDRDGPSPRFPPGALGVYTFDTDDWKAVAPGEASFKDFLTPIMLKD